MGVEDLYGLDVVNYDNVSPCISADFKVSNMRAHTLTMLEQNQGNVVDWPIINLFAQRAALKDGPEEASDEINEQQIKGTLEAHAGTTLVFIMRHASIKASLSHCLTRTTTSAPKPTTKT